MKLCINSFLGAKSIILFDTNNTCVASNSCADIVSSIADCLQKVSCSPEDISDLYIVKGPGPFTAVRNTATVANSWKLSIPSVNLYSIATGIFLQCAFPEAKNLFLSAGKSAFFAFEKENLENFTKHPITELQKYSGTYGGYLYPDTNIPESLLHISALQDQEVFQNILQEAHPPPEDLVLPVYGAEANITLAG